MPVEGLAQQLWDGICWYMGLSADAPAGRHTPPQEQNECVLTLEGECVCQNSVDLESGKSSKVHSFKGRRET